MNTKTVGLLAVAVLVAGGAWYLSAGRGEAPTLSEDTTVSEHLAAAGTLADLMADNHDVTCKVRNTTEAGVSEGVVYISGDKVRADFSTNVEAMGGTAIDSHMIKEGEWVYSWSSAAPQGMKVKVAADASADASGAMSGSWEDMYKAGAYDCVPWTVDASLFTPPADVTFMELSGMVPQGL